jgi:hypothetical protein
MGSAATALQKSSETTSNEAAVRESVKTAATASLTEIEIAIPRRDTRTEFEMAEFRWKGHWEVWEMEWGPHARWVWD